MKRPGVKAISRGFVGLEVRIPTFPLVVPSNTLPVTVSKAICVVPTKLVSVGL